MVTNRNKQRPLKRLYPPFYEKAVPVALGIIVVAIIILLAVSIVVALNLLSGTG